MSGDRIISCSDLMLKMMNLTDFNGSELPSVWKNVVSKVNNYGERLAGNTRVIDLKNGVLLIEADHPGWIQITQMYSKFILTGLSRALPDLKIASLAFRLAGSRVSLSESYQNMLEKSGKKFNEKIESQEKEIDRILGHKKDYPAAENVLPPEIQKKFERLKKTVLTNSKK